MGLFGLRRKFERQILNGIKFEYRHQIEVRTEVVEKKTFERDPETKKRKLVSKTSDRKQWLIVEGLDGQIICSVSEEQDNVFKVFTYPKLAWGKEEPDFVYSGIDDCYNGIEQICYKAYIKKHGSLRPSYSSSSHEKKFKRLSIGEICEWYEDFRKTDMTIQEIQEAVVLKAELEQNKLTMDDLKQALRVHSFVTKLYGLDRK